MYKCHLFNCQCVVLVKKSIKIVTALVLEDWSNWVPQSKKKKNKIHPPTIEFSNIRMRIN